ncbi:MAG: hypothetical protein ACI945_000395 [Pseudohongiellaceae bacterium]
MYSTEDLIPAPRCSSTTTLLLVGVVWFVSSCSPSNPATADSMGQPNKKIINTITMNHAEIRRDILAELHKREIQYWINEDRSIGFPPADVETIDSIYYEVVGAYAARN